MRFSTRSTYGLRALACLAKNYGQGSLSINQISQQEKISKKYLETIFAVLKKAGIVKSSKGVSGGYELVKHPSEINTFEIINVLEKNMKVFACVHDDHVFCPQKDKCQIGFVLLEIQKAINQSLKNIKLNQLIK